MIPNLFYTMKVSQLKRSLSLFFLYLFCFSTLQSVIPYFEYILNYQYIAKVLCVNKEKVKLNCNGKCHLKKQLSKTVSDSTTKNQNRIPTIKYDKRFLISLKLEPSLLFKKRRGIKPMISYFEHLKQKNHSKHPTPPPQIYLIT